MCHLQVLVLILRLRQACLHPVLTTTGVGPSTNENLKEETYRRRASMMQNIVIQRLIQQEQDEETAEVCFHSEGVQWRLHIHLTIFLVSHLHGCQ